MKSLLIALALLSAPAFADTIDNSLNTDGARADWSFGFNFGPRGPSFGFGWGPRHPGWGHHRPVQCIARNLRGYQFAGYGRWQNEAAQNAMYSCYNAGSRRCDIVWCR